MIFLISFLIDFFFKKKKRFGFNLLLVIYGIFNFLVCVQDGQVKGHSPGDGSEKSEGIICTLDHGHDYLFLNPCAHGNLYSYLHICKLELVYKKSHIKKVKLFMCNIN